jgi:hypothetical protein
MTQYYVYITNNRVDSGVWAGVVHDAEHLASMYRTNSMPVFNNVTSSYSIFDSVVELVAYLDRRAREIGAPGWLIVEQHDLGNGGVRWRVVLDDKFDTRTKRDSCGVPYVRYRRIAARINGKLRLSKDLKAA